MYGVAVFFISNAMKNEIETIQILNHRLIMIYSVKIVFDGKDPGVYIYTKIDGTFSDCEYITFNGYRWDEEYFYDRIYAFSLDIFPSITDRDHICREVITLMECAKQERMYERYRKWQPVTVSSSFVVG